MVVALETLIGQYAPDFELPGVDGDVHHLTQYLMTHQAVGVVIMSNYCPYVRQFLGYLKQLQTQLSPQGFTLVGINGNHSTSDEDECIEGMLKLSQAHQINFPYLRDKTQDVLRTFHAKTTPEVFLLDHAGIVRYAGAIAVNAGTTGDNLIGHPGAVLEIAIAQLLEGEPINPEHTKVIGTPIRWRI